MPHAIHQNFTAAPWDRTKSSVFEFGNHFPQRHPESFREMLELGRTEPVNINARILFPDVMQQVDIPRELQFLMMPALHQDLNPAHGQKFVELLINLLKAKNVMILVFLGPIKGAEFAVNVADVRVVDIAIDDISHDIAPAAAITFRFCQIASGISKHTKFFQWPAI